MLLGLMEGPQKQWLLWRIWGGRILKTVETGSSNPRNVGLKTAAENIAQGINKLKRGRILAIFVGLPAVGEEYKSKMPEIKKEIFKRISKGLRNKTKIVSDQLIAFRSGTDELNGIVIIAGTGCVVHGWREKREAKAGGWGWLADEGSAFWTGQKFCQAVLKGFDGRSSKILLPKIKKPESLLKKIYSRDSVGSVSLFSILCDSLAKKGNKKAKEIIIDAAEEIVLAANTVIKKLNFQKKRFPVVLVGGMFKSRIFLETVKSKIKKLAPKAELILPKQRAVIGAVKLALK